MAAISLTDRVGHSATTARVLLVGGAIATALLLGACDGGTPTAAPTPSSSAVLPSAAASSAPSAVPSKPARTVKITASAYLQVADTYVSGPRDTATDEAMLPTLCNKSFASKGKITERQSRHIVYVAVDPKGGDFVPDGGLTQTITLYQPGGAEQFLSELRAIIGSCPRGKANNRPTRYAIASGAKAGDDSFVFSMTAAWHSDPSNDDSPMVDETRLISVVRIGDVVTVLWERGWEGGSSDARQVDVLTGRAVARINTWLKG
ncbi:hypothetical protein F4553_004256 [Allocatelliglobosispora scoriae]|uniref:PknH-like extracellular domain-containing protein n=1 Tax=Allocatelliglobosispora scoriae TaxID=643052 RepID=A0A841BP68_9ACTN|nr:hypothetical protein [Allocatelliglobosispora scoriae]MBB5870877.1 hypothetical protein [Allocatelliglobosispora scoriae]